MAGDMIITPREPSQDGGHAALATKGVRHCGWCRAFLGFAPELDGQRLTETTGCCDPCLEKLLAEIGEPEDVALAGEPVAA